MDILIYPTASQRFKYIYNPEQRKTQYGISHCLMPRTKTKQCKKVKRAMKLDYFA